MPITVHHAFTSPLADGSVTQLVKPSNWNAPHIATYNAAGTEIIGAFSNANNVSFGTNASGYVTASASYSVGGGVAISAGTNSTSTGTVVFGSSAGNVTFGMGTNGYVTASAPSGGGGGVAVSAGTNSTATGTVVFSNANGLTFGMDTAGAVTGSYTVPVISDLQPISNTSNITSNALNTSQSSLFQQTSNTSAITSNAVNTSVTGSFLQTSQSSLFQQTSATSAITSNALNTSQSSLFQQTSATSAITSAAFPSANTTKFAGTGFTSTTTAGTAITAALGTNGLTFAQPAFLTTYVNDLTSGRAGTGTTYAGTNVSATIGLNTDGLNLQLSAPTPGGGAINVTAGTTSGNLQTIQFNNANGVSFGLNGSTITASITPSGGAQTGISSIAVSNTTYTSGQISFSDANGISFGTGAGQAINITHGLQYTSNTSAITASALNTSQSSLFQHTSATSAITSNAMDTSERGNYFYTSNNTFANSTHSHNLATTTTNGSLVVIATTNSAGATMAVPPYITTYVNDLTSGRAGTGFTSTTTAGTAITAALDTNGLTFAQPAFLTTYVNDLTSGRAGTGFTSTTTAGTAVVATNNTAGLSMAVPAFLTTYVNDLTSGRAGTGFTSTTTAGTAVVATNNTAGLSMAVPNFITTYVNDLTSGRAGTGFTSASTAGVVIVATNNTNGLSMGVPNYITTYVNDLTSGRAGTGTTFAGTNVSATIGLDTNGLNLQLSAPTPGGGGAINVSAGTTSGNLQTIQFNNANGVSFGLNGSTVTASVNAGGGGAAIGVSTGGNTSNTTGVYTSGSYVLAGGNNVTLSQVSGTGGATLTISVPQGGGIGVSNLGNTAGSTGAVSDQVVMVGTNGMLLSQSTNGQSATISIGRPLTNLYAWPPRNWWTNVSQPQNATASIQMISVVQPVTGTQMGFYLYQSLVSSAAANTYGQVFSIYMQVLTNDAANLRLMTLYSGSTQTTYTVASNTAGATQINGSGIRPITCPVNFTLTEGQYHVAVNFVTNTFSSGTATTALGRSHSIVGVPTLSASNAFVTAYDQATGATVNPLFPIGAFTAASTGLPLTISHSQLNLTGSAVSQANIAVFFRG